MRQSCFTSKRLTASIAIWLASLILAAAALPALAQSDIPGGPSDDPQGGDSGSSGTDDICAGDTCSGESGNSGAPGRSQNGNSSGGEGEQVNPAPSPTATPTTNRTSTPARSRRTSRAASSARPSPSPSIATILLYPETATPIPDPLPTNIQEASESEAEVEQAANPVQEPVRETDSGGFPVRRIVGILATLVAVGSAWSLIMSGRSRPGRRSMGRASRRV